MKNSMNELVVPAAMQLFLDDVGWMHGWNRMDQEDPSRTGLPRKHVLADYHVLEAIGRSVGMKVCVALTLGEWDLHNWLRDVPNSNKLGAAWDSAPYLDVAKANAIRDFLNGTEYVDFAVHGLLHHFWVDGERLGCQEFFYPRGYKRHAPLEMASEDYIRKHLDTFFALYHEWGFAKEIRAFASPGGCTEEAWKTDVFTRILKDYGIRFWCNNSIGYGCVSDGIIKNPKVTEMVDWETYDVDPALLPTYAPERVGIMGGHWPNVLRFNPEHNLERVDAWKAFFLRNAETFGVMLSRDIGFAHCQQMYRQYATVAETENGWTLDCTAVDAMMPADLRAPIYVSIRGNGQLACQGGTLSLYETKKEFTTYQIKRDDGSLIHLALKA